MTLRVRWLGRVPYREAHDLQKALFEHSADDHLLLLEHPHVYTLGVRADMANVLVPPASVGAELCRTDRGGDVTYHGPGQLVGYPILTLPGKRGGSGAQPAEQSTRSRMADTVAYVRSVEQLIIDALGDLEVAANRLPDYPGVWIGERKVCAIGVKLTRGRSMHGFALNVDPDLTMFSHIVPCGIADKQVTSLRAEGCAASMKDVVDAISARAVTRWGAESSERQDVAWKRGSAPTGLALGARKPDWVRAPMKLGEQALGLKHTMRDLELVTVCEEAGCPNLSECWSAGTATFMINGDRCTRACSFCLVDTRKPFPVSADEPQRVAEAVVRMGLLHAVVTAVARDDMPDGGAAGFAETVRAIRRRQPDCAIEVLIPDCKGDLDSLAVIFDARPDVMNHNLETVARLQRLVRPSAGYARSLATLGRAKAAGLVTKSGLILGMGETDHEVVGALADLRAVGVDIVTLGQYLRPSADHLPVARWVDPATFASLKEVGEAMGIPHVESSPLTRSSYHAREAAAAAG